MKTKDYLNAANKLKKTSTAISFIVSHIFSVIPISERINAAIEHIENPNAY